MSELGDAKQRRTALDPTQSFIVQAPAGSGKTELLTQRLLTLLTTVEHPEEIIAITFTRKAAHEMRERVVLALQAGCGPAPSATHARHTWSIAQKALARDAEQEWHLLDNPNRLRILTIDAFCAHLTRQLPLAAGLGATPTIIDDAAHFYRQSARELLQRLDDQGELADALADFLLHIDNLHERAEQLLADLLACRDQWLPYLGYQHDSEALRPILEGALAQLGKDALAQLADVGHMLDLDELQHLIHFAADQLDDTQLKAFQADSFTLDDLTAWQRVAKLLLTSDGQWRKQVTKAQGFPAPSSCKDSEQKAFWQDMKQRMLALLQSASEQPELLDQLRHLLLLPALHYDEQQWTIIRALLVILPNLAAQLLVNFQQYTVIDHIEIAQRALQALGDEDNPTNLALALDYQLKHLLIDEFQDTSSIQFRLLEKLTAAWQVGDGRSLFLVGDPMQSIYRFRKAEVGLFLQAKAHGVGPIALQALTLTSNFRAQAGMVDWLNQTFSEVFPADNNISAGAINYSPADAVLAASEARSVQIHAHDEAEHSESHTIIEIIRATAAENSIAILVKARSHLASIIPALQQAGIAYRATELESLYDKHCIQDLLSLTKALLHLGDRLAWLSVLRAPFCGLSLADIHQIAYQEQSRPIWERLCRYQELSLSRAGKARLARIVPLLDACLSQYQRLPLAQWLENAWLALGGPACLATHEELSHAQAFFTILQNAHTADDISDWEALESRLAGTTVNTSPTGPAQVEIMTIHKAKGLEFDVVIIPRLAQATRAQDNKLLLWTEYTSRDQQHLLLAPIRHSQASHDPVYRYIQQLEQGKDRLEEARLLYVAATRAKQHLHLLASVKQTLDDQGYKQLSFSKQSFLGTLWPQVEMHFREQLTHALATPDAQRLAAPGLSRLSVNWDLPQDLNPQLLQLTSAHNPVQNYDITPQDMTLRHIGIVIHQVLQVIAEQGLTDWSSQRLHTQQNWLSTQLRNLQMPATHIPQALQLILSALEYTLNDETGRWLLSPHQDAQCEYPLTLRERDKTQLLIIDRTFIDNEGVRWIIDYKTAYQEHEQSDFIQSQISEHQAQLQRYAAAIAQLDPRPIRLGLYFPLMQHWHQWEY